MQSPPSPPALPECENVHQDEQGVWHAVHASGRPVRGESWSAIVADACAVRIIASWRKVWS